MEAAGNSILYKARFPLAILFIGLVTALGYYPSQSDFGIIAGLFLPLFLLYVYIGQQASPKAQVLFWVGVGMLVRFILLFSFPNLSDDIYRFVWDGRLIVEGVNPFEQLPSYYLDADFQIPGINQALYDELNSPEYFTIYPPIAQTVFAGAVSMAGDNLYVSSIVMKVFLLACEIGAIMFILRILEHLALPIKNVLWYALNPLVIIEVMGNLHFEGAMVFFFLMSFYFILQSKYGIAGFAMGLSIASKLLPLMFLPTLLHRIFADSLDLYFRKFEFNASIFYAVREIGTPLLGWNPIQFAGPIFSLLTVGYILVETFRRPKQSPENWLCTTLLVFTCYLAFATTIHPWYLSLPIVMCLFTNYRYPILWSGLIMMTYINYAGAEYQENLWVVLIEYVLVFGYMVYEFRKYPPMKEAEVVK